MTHRGKTVLYAFLFGWPALGWAQGGEIRIGGLVLPTRQNVLGATGLVHSSGTLSGLEFLARTDMAGLYGRYLTGTVGNSSARGPDGRLRAAEVRLMLGPQAFSIEGGYAVRARSGSLGRPHDALVRVGFRSSIGLGPSGLSLNLTAGALGRSDSVGSDKKLAMVGWEGSTGVLYQAPRGLPLYSMLGFRYERIRSEESHPPVQREELSSIVFGIGIRRPGKSKPPATQAQ